MTNAWNQPERHPITIEQAKTLMSSDLGDVYRDILMKSCAPIFWFRLCNKNHAILDNGTVTFVENNQGELLGITAEHVIRGYREAADKEPVRLQIANAVLDDLDVISTSRRLDIATFRLGSDFLQTVGKRVSSVRIWRGESPCEGRGIMLAGFPAGERIEPQPFEVDSGLFTALGVARSVTNEQITWVPEPEYCVKVPSIPKLPSNLEFGGISGGPLIAWFESPNHLATYALVGIVSQAHSQLENVVAKRADFIRDDGTIREPS